MNEHHLKDHVIKPSIEDGMVKLDFGGQMSFLKMPAPEARKLAMALHRLADTAQFPDQAEEDASLQIAKHVNDSLRKPGSVAVLIGLNEEQNYLVIKFSDFTNKLEMTPEQAATFVGGIQGYLSQLRRR